MDWSILIKDIKMRYRRYFFIFLVISLIILESCQTTDDDGDLLTNKWILTGTAKFSSTSTDLSSDVKLAAFYTGSSNVLSTSSIRVSNIVNLGNLGDTTTDFTLNINAEDLTPLNGGLITLSMWKDDNTNDKYDSGEKFIAAVSKKGSGCPCFGDESDDIVCNYLFDYKYDAIRGSKKGWNQAKSKQAGSDKYNYIPIDEAILNGAIITSEKIFSN